jgi:hypothetical protein
VRKINEKAAVSSPLHAACRRTVRLHLGPIRVRRPVTADENEFYISVVNGCADPLHGVVYEYYLGETLLGSGMCTEADGGYMERNEQLDHAFLREDFPDGASLSGFSIRFYVINSDSNAALSGGSRCFFALLRKRLHLPPHRKRRGRLHNLQGGLE